jgi:threonine/homoserine/homoserine lactone efflux protein
VGAVAAYLVALTAQTSLRTGVFAALGVATADGMYALIAVCGGAALAAVLRPVTLPLRRGPAVVLIALAVHGTVAAVRRHRERRDGTGASRTAPGAARAYLGMRGPLPAVADEQPAGHCRAGGASPVAGRPS